MRRVYKNVCPATIGASIMAANMWKNTLKNVESDNNKILYETLLDFFFTAKRYLVSEQASSMRHVLNSCCRFYLQTPVQISEGWK